MASLVGAFSVILVLLSVALDTPTGPSIVLAALTMFIITQVMTAAHETNRKTSSSTRCVAGLRHR